MVKRLLAAGRTLNLIQLVLQVNVVVTEGSAPLRQPRGATCT